jgi:hypothetical protein
MPLPDLALSLTPVTFSLADGFHKSKLKAHQITGVRNC